MLRYNHGRVRAFFPTFLKIAQILNVISMPWSFLLDSFGYHGGMQADFGLKILWHSEHGSQWENPKMYYTLKADDCRMKRMKIWD